MNSYKASSALPTELSINRSGIDQVRLTLRVDDNLFWFQGHFPDQPILPGVTQVDWAIRYALRVFDLKGSFSGVDKVKFQRPILPGNTLELLLNWDGAKQKLAFQYILRCEDDQPQIVASSGIIKLCR